jgi:DNA-binding NarL/FixJ family response regulator
MKPARLSVFSVARAYYQSSWFRAACGFTLLALLWRMYRYRLGQVAREFNLRMEERVAERGRNALSAIRGEFPDARVIVLTSYAGDVQISRALRAGARAYLLKDMLRKELLETIRAVHAGQKRLSAEIAAEIAEHALEDTLTPREMDVLRLIAVGNANREIAAQFGLSEETVKSHVKNILAKLGANDRTHAVTIGLKRGIIDL